LSGPLGGPYSADENVLRRVGLSGRAIKWFTRAILLARGVLQLARYMERKYTSWYKFSIWFRKSPAYPKR
jgi:hypothetical protein